MSKFSDAGTWASCSCVAPLTLDEHAPRDVDVTCHLCLRLCLGSEHTEKPLRELAHEQAATQAVLKVWGEAMRLGMLSE